MNRQWPRPIRQLAGRLDTFWLRSPFGQPDSLRVLAYHEIVDSDGFEAQLEYLVSMYNPVTISDVVKAMAGGSLPPRPVWVTFDDGDPSVVELGLSGLDKHGIEATMFVCPGVIDTEIPFWWQIVERASESGLQLGSSSEDEPSQALMRLKMMPDPRRHAEVEELRQLLEEQIGEPFCVRQLTSEQLSRWRRSGHAVGNHTWSHPLLDRCDGNEQERQIKRAHAWLSERVGQSLVAFAYPNGNWTGQAERILRDLGYRVAVLFDHRLAQLEEPMKLSRIRTRADGDLSRFRAMVSGLHPRVHSLVDPK